MTTRFLVAAVGCAAVATIAVAAAWKHAPLLIWNASASVPLGLYAVHEAGGLTAGELVVVQPPEALAAWLAAGRYLPRGVPLIKHVTALPNSIVCRSGLTISVEGIVRAKARERDHAGRLLPTWSGCRMVGRDEVFLLNPSEPASLDSRYFGPLPMRSIVGRAVPLWTEPRS